MVDVSAGSEGASAGVAEPPDSEGPIFVEMDPSGRYGRFDQILGRGAFKTVYKAFDTQEGTEVAWNQVRVSELVNCRDSKEERDRLFAEIRVLKQLKHKNIMTIYDSWLDSKTMSINFITELFTSGNLRQYRKRHKHIDGEVLKRWAWQVLCGLVYLHGHTPPIIHRDIKCDNIFINGSDGTVKIGDLGLATMLRRRSGPQTVLGTPEFMAPELYEEEYDDRVDVYSYGMCLLELATMETPYAECKNPAQIYRKVSLGVRPAGLQKVTSQDLADFINLCIASREQRPRARMLLKHPYFDSIRPICTLASKSQVGLSTVISQPDSLSDFGGSAGVLSRSSSTTAETAMVDAPLCALAPGALATSATASAVSAPASLPTAGGPPSAGSAAGVSRTVSAATDLSPGAGGAGSSVAGSIKSLRSNISDLTSVLSGISEEEAVETLAEASQREGSPILSSPTGPVPDGGWEMLPPGRPALPLAAGSSLPAGSSVSPSVLSPVSAPSPTVAPSSPMQPSALPSSPPGVTQASSPVAVSKQVSQEEDEVEQLLMEAAAEEDQLCCGDGHAVGVAGSSQRRFLVVGKYQEDNDTFNLRLRICEPSGQARTVEFEFDISRDTAISVASEMVEDLQLSEEDAAAIATAIRDEIANLTTHLEEQLSLSLEQASAALQEGLFHSAALANSSPRPNSFMEYAAKLGMSPHASPVRVHSLSASPLGPVAAKAASPTAVAGGGGGAQADGQEEAQVLPAEAVATPGKTLVPRVTFPITHGHRPSFADVLLRGTDEQQQQQQQEGQQEGRSAGLPAGRRASQGGLTQELANASKPGSGAATPRATPAVGVPALAAAEQGPAAGEEKVEQLASSDGTWPHRAPLPTSPFTHREHAPAVATTSGPSASPTAPLAPGGPSLSSLPPGTLAPSKSVGSMGSLLSFTSTHSDDATTPHLGSLTAAAPTELSAASASSSDSARPTSPPARVTSPPIAVGAPALPGARLAPTPPPRAQHPALARLLRTSSASGAGFGRSNTGVAGGDKQGVGLSPTTGQSLASSGALSPASGVLSPAVPQDKHIPLNKLFENLQGLATRENGVPTSLGQAQTAAAGEPLFGPRTLPEGQRTSPRQLAFAAGSQSMPLPGAAVTGLGAQQQQQLGGRQLLASLSGSALTDSWSSMPPQQQELARQRPASEACLTGLVDKFDPFNLSTDSEGMPVGLPASVVAQHQAAVLAALAAGTDRAATPPAGTSDSPPSEIPLCHSGTVAMLANETVARLAEQQLLREQLAAQQAQQGASAPSSKSTSRDASPTRGSALLSPTRLGGGVAALAASAACDAVAAACLLANGKKGKTETDKEALRKQAANAMKAVELRSLNLLEGGLLAGKTVRGTPMAATRLTSMAGCGNPGAGPGQVPASNPMSATPPAACAVGGPANGISVAGMGSMAALGGIGSPRKTGA
ncbi:hypothetical protein N2152v2_010192 [Parachlorella kessleri]